MSCKALSGFMIHKDKVEPKMFENKEI